MIAQEMDNSTCVIAGRLDLCYNLEWRAVCHVGWDENEAKVVCQQFGFPEEGRRSKICPCSKA